MPPPRRNLHDILLATFAATGSFLFGYDSGVMTDVIASPAFLAYFSTRAASPVVGAVNSTFSGGAAVGAVAAGLTLDRLGRRRTIQVGAAVAACGGALQAGAVGLGMMLFGRVVSGLAVGVLSVGVPVYQAECARPEVRGLVVGLTQQMIGVGFIVSTWVGYGCRQAADDSSLQWRFPLAFQVLPALVLLVGLFWLPESPRWLIERGRDARGMAVLRRLHSDGGGKDDWIRKEYNEIRATISAEKALGVASSWGAIFAVREWRWRLMLGTLVQVFTQLTGINVINAYQTLLYTSLGLTGERAVLVAGLYNCVGPLTNLIFVVFLLDRVGRRRPLLFGAIAISLALIVEAALTAANPGGQHPTLSAAGVAMIFLVSIVFSSSFGPIAWVYVSEIMPMQIRGKGVAFATGVGNWAVGTALAQVSPVALGKIGWRYYFVFVGFNLLVTVPTVWSGFKETSRLSLEEIDVSFGGRALGTLPRVVEEKDVEEAVRRESIVQAKGAEVRQLSVSIRMEQGD